MSVFEKSCGCGAWKTRVRVTTPLQELNPRICDCSYCQRHPSAVVSDPSMEIELVGGLVRVTKNGDELAEFYHCDSCGDFLAVGCDLKGVLRGAANSVLLGNASELGDSINIQPRFLKAEEKLERWGKLWGTLVVTTLG